MYRPSGIIASLVTHFTPAGAIDRGGIVKTVDVLARRGVHGVCICGGTGEALSLTDEEHAAAVEAAVEGAAGRCGVVAGALYLDPARIAAAGRAAARGGADAVMIIAPYFVRPSADDIYEHVARLTDLVELPLILFNSPSRAGLDMDARLLVRIATQLPKVVGVKEASGNLAKFARVVRESPSDFRMLQGLDDLVLPALALGGAGALITLGAVIPGTFVRLFEAVNKNDLAAARVLQLAALPVIDAVYETPNPSGTKRLLDLLGRPGGPVRPPLRTMRPGQDEHLTRLLPIIEQLEPEAVHGRVAGSRR
ncbi:MAG: dihydrodipicolinate synthase family protein [Bacillati bacterium ANGP1]|uniref:Dihydrodipicolinate synthase family protein n=1 Tax=Candidatus Segetimicrobium genomatis TaxID=2569760 RepID=A0A537JJF9_9BACT|nr:MAG: dihydrodipicolinate synthase family protein [Terrabacteria group bacterium ANGP1]